MRKINILSLFDGIACGRVALDRANICIDNYFASEIDKYAIQIALKNYPDIIELGDINTINFSQLTGKIDLLIGGSPCQNLSSINTTTNYGLKGKKSSLFYKYVEALDVVKPKYFLFENVASMKKEDKSIVTQMLGVDPILIDSALLSAQTRRRFYWTNIGAKKGLLGQFICGIKQPEDKGIYTKDVLEKYVSDEYYISEKMKGYIFSSHEKFNNNYKINMDKARPLTVAHDKRANTTNYFSDDYINGGSPDRIRRLTPIECERLQTLPDNYSKGISRT